MPVLAVAAELGPVARLAVPVAELDAQRSFGFRRDRESVPGTRIDWHDLRCDRYHVMGAPEPLYVVEACALQDRKSTRLNPVTNAHLVCRLLLEKKKQRYMQTKYNQT